MRRATSRVAVCRMASWLHTRWFSKSSLWQICRNSAPLLTGDEAYSQGFPTLYTVFISQIITTTNWSWGMYLEPLSHGAMRTLEHHGSDEQKQKFLGTVAEPLDWNRNAWLNLGRLWSWPDSCQAVPNEAGSYSISGEKIFISAGEHDLAENIVHIVLARLPDAPAGTKVFRCLLCRNTIWMKAWVMWLNGVV
jgi:alkylation response protein AidB-like acyl-CoA dehydrogenase